MLDFEQLSHTADIKMRVYGSKKEELFANAVIGMFQILGPHANGCEIKNDHLVCKVLPFTHEIEVASIDIESLMVDFLSEVWYTSDVHNEAYLKAEILTLTENYIKAQIHGVKITGFDVVEIKAVTYNELRIEQINGIWQADIVFDI